MSLVSADLRVSPTGVPFVKMQGAGNDFVVIDGREGLPCDPAKLALSACDRNFGVGSDGLVILTRSETSDFGMLFFNPDGSRAICLNGMRCLARYICMLGLVDSRRTNFTLETDRGAVGVRVFEDSDTCQSVKDACGRLGRRVEIEIGEPMFDGALVPTSDAGEHIRAKLDVAGESFTFTAVGMGNPHCVIFCSDVRTVPLSTIGPKIEHHPFFPKRTNVEFVKVVDRHSVEMRVWERGAGETLSCGTGCCAVLAAAVREGRTEREIKLTARGGEFQLRWDESTNKISLTGPATEVFSGVLDLSHLLKHGRPKLLQ